jgi:hypothetical protein
VLFTNVGETKKQHTASGIDNGGLQNKATVAAFNAMIRYRSASQQTSTGAVSFPGEAPHWSAHCVQPIKLQPETSTLTQQSKPVINAVHERYCHLPNNKS